MVMLLSVVFISGCGGGEDRQEKYIERAQEYFDAENYDKAKIEVKNALQINPKSADGRYLLGKLAEVDQNWPSAYSNFKAAIEEDPNHILANTRAAALLMGAQEYDNSQKHIDTILAIEPDNIEALVINANLMAARGDVDQATELSQKILSMDAGNVGAAALLAKIYVENDPELALEIVNKTLSQQSKSDVLKMIKINLLTRENKVEEVEAAYEELLKDYPDRLLYAYQFVNFYLRNEVIPEEVRKDKAEALLTRLIESKPEEDQIKLWMIEFLLKNRGVDEAMTTLEKYVAQSPENMALLDALAGRYLVSGEPEKALGAYKAFIAMDDTTTDSLSARNKLANIYFLEKRMDEGNQALNEVFEIEPSNQEALVIRGNLRVNSGDISGAISDLRLGLKADPNDKVALQFLGRAYLAENSIDLAQDIYSRLLSLDPKSSLAHNKLARILASKEQVKDAISLLEDALTINPNDVEAAQLLVDLYSRDQRWDDAISVAGQLLNNEKTAGIGYYLQGRVYLRKQDYSAAISALEKSLDIESRTVEALSSLVSAYTAVEQEAKAISYLNNHIKANPEHIHARELLATVHAGRGDLVLATEMVEALIESNPDRVSAYRLLTRLYATQNQLDKLEALYKSGIEKNPDMDGLKMMLVELYQGTGRYKEARVEYEAILMDNPDSLVIKNNLASLLLDYFNNEKNIQRAAELSIDLAATDNPAFLDTAGWTKYHQGNYPQAVSLLQAAVSKGGTGPVFRYHLGMAMYKSNMAAAAKEQLELALADEKVNFPGKEEAQKVLSSL
jgi:tetratricopeptide (TPR) repeat protein